MVTQNGLKPVVFVNICQGLAKINAEEIHVCIVCVNKSKTYRPMPQRGAANEARAPCAHGASSRPRAGKARRAFPISVLER